jgi:hypothetical protein
VAIRYVRTSSHPGQFTLFDSENERTRRLAVEELEVQAEVMDAMRLGPEAVVVPHVGGAAGGVDAAAGIVVRDPSQPGREVRYGLTDAGLALEPVVDALTLWGIENAFERPLGGEPVHPEPAMIGTKVLLNRDAPGAPDGLAWVWRFPGEEDFTLRSESGDWRLSRGG